MAVSIATVVLAFLIAVIVLTAEGAGDGNPTDAARHLLGLLPGIGAALAPHLVGILTAMITVLLGFYAAAWGQQRSDLEVATKRLRGMGQAAVLLTGALGPVIALVVTAGVVDREVTPLLFGVVPIVAAMWLLAVQLGRFMVASVEEQLAQAVRTEQRMSARIELISPDRALPAPKNPLMPIALQALAMYAVAAVGTVAVDRFSLWTLLIAAFNGTMMVALVMGITFVLQAHHSSGRPTVMVIAGLSQLVINAPLVAFVIVWFQGGLPDVAFVLIGAAVLVVLLALVPWSRLPDPLRPVLSLRWNVLTLSVAEMQTSRQSAIDRQASLTQQIAAATTVLQLAKTLSEVRAEQRGPRA